MRLRRTPERSARRDWLPIAISLGSLAISFLGAYFSTLRTLDDVRVIVLDDPDAYVWKGSDTLGDESAKIAVKANFAASFINSGTRPATIDRVWLTLNQPDDVIGKGRLDCGFGIAFDADLGLSGRTEIEPNKLVTVPLSLRGTSFLMDDNAQLFEQSSSNKQAKEAKVLACLNFRVVTPAGLSNIQKPFFQKTMPKDEFRSKAFSADRLWRKGEAVTLVRNVQYIFAN